MKSQRALWTKLLSHALQALQVGCNPAIAGRRTLPWKVPAEPSRGWFAVLEIETSSRSTGSLPAPLVTGLQIKNYGTVLRLKTTALQKCGAVPRRACIADSQIGVSLNSRLESNEDEEKITEREYPTPWWPCWRAGSRRSRGP